MTDRGSTASYRHIGDQDQEEASPARTGLRRISEGRQAPAATPTAPAADDEAKAGSTTEEWSVPHPDDLEGEATDTKDTEEATTTAKRKRPRVAAAASTTREGRRPLMIVSAVAVVLAAAVIVLGVLFVQANSRENLRSSALSAARNYGVILSSYDYRNLTGSGSDWTKVEQVSTPTFRKNFLSTSGELSKLLTQYNAVATGKVLNAGIESLNGNRAVILLFIDQTVNNTVQQSQGTTQPLRSQLTLVHQGGKWLIDDLQVPK